MNIVINVFAILMGFFGFILIFGGIFNKHLGLIFGGVVYSLGAYFAYNTTSFIPFVIAFVGAWILRKIGFDPSP